MLVTAATFSNNYNNTYSKRARVARKLLLAGMYEDELCKMCNMNIVQLESSIQLNTLIYMSQTLIYMSQDYIAKCENICGKYVLSFGSVNDRGLFCFQEREL